MKLTLIKSSLLGLVATALVATPVWSSAQDTSSNAPAASAPAPAKHKKHDKLLFHGKVSALDASAMTLTVDSLQLQVTSETKITKDGKPATLSKGAIGENAAGTYKKGSDGKLTATTIHFGVKSKKKSTKEEAPASAPAATPPN